MASLNIFWASVQMQNVVLRVEKKDIDWTALGFAYTQCDYSYVAHYKDGAWDEGGLTTDHSITQSECANILNYCQ